MRRPIVLTWLVTSVVPLLSAMALLGCCALPFHRMLHQVMPCEMAQMALTAQHHGGHGGHEQPAAPAAPQRNGQDAFKQVWKSEARQAAPLPPAVVSIVRLAGPVGQRSQIALGAARCDDDVGTRLALLDTLRI